MRLMILLALLLVSGSLSAQTQGAIKRVCHVSRFELAVACIKKYEGLHGPKHHPYVGYGHKLLPGERFSPKRRNGKPMPCCALTSESCALCIVASVVTRCSWLHLPTMWDVER